MKKELVVLVREVTVSNPDGSLCSRQTETVDAVIGWPEGKPDDHYSAYIGYSDWKIAKINRIAMTPGNRAADAAMIELLREERNIYRADRLALYHALRSAVGGFAENPGHSDLDDVQPIALHVSLGAWRKWKNLVNRIERSVNRPNEV